MNRDDTARSGMKSRRVSKAAADFMTPLGIILIVASMIVPLPAWFLDYALIGNLLFALALLGSALFSVDPLALSVLPTLLLLGALTRLALNVSSTRLILSASFPGEVIEAFGRAMLNGDLVVGLVVFLMITLIQFIVIAKGAERVAEVAARFTLDALPGKQMSIDADLRSGVIDPERARQRREEIQVESRFYGALDGAMKFVKGDAIAGLIIVAVNLIGGFIVGLVHQGLSLQASIDVYSTLTIGDGLVSQIPALLNSLTAGLVVTRVHRADGAALSTEMVQQVLQGRTVRVILGVLSLGISCTGVMPALPFLVAGSGLLASCLGRAPNIDQESSVCPALTPRIPPLLSVEYPASEATVIDDVRTELESFRLRLYGRAGLLVAPVELEAGRSKQCVIRLRGLPIASVAVGQTADLPSKMREALDEVCVRHAVELVDDIMTRRLLDAFDREAPELVSAAIPAVISVTQFTVLLRQLVRERVNIRHLDQILQAIAEGGLRGSSEVALLAEIRQALGRVVCAPYISGACSLAALVLDPVLDLICASGERDSDAVDDRVYDEMAQQLSDQPADLPLLCSKNSRATIEEALRSRDVARAVLAYEEVPSGVLVEQRALIRVRAAEENELVEALAA